jgi:hypothetical protein
MGCFGISLPFFLVLVLAILRGNLEFNLWQFQEGIIRITSSYGQNWKNGGMMERGFPNLETIPSWANLFSPDLWDLVETWCFPWEKTCRYFLVGGLEHGFYDFPYTGNNKPNWLSYFSEG